MRIWDVDPSLLCRSHLLGEHRELHGLWKNLTLGKAGYGRHPETVRRVGRLAALHRRHEALVAEMTRRGYRHFSSLNPGLAAGSSVQDRYIDEPAIQMRILGAKPCACPLELDSAVNDREAEDGKRLQQRLRAAGLLLLSLSACDPTTQRPSPSVVRDSASVTIVENSSPRWENGRGWRLSENPVISIGSAEGPAEYRFHEIAGVVRLDGGEVAVADRGSNQLRLYSTDGTHLWSAGGEGDGPGEIRQAFGLLRAGSDTLLVPDGLQRVHLYSTAGRYAGTFQPLLESGHLARPLGVARDGYILYETHSPHPMGIVQPVESRVRIVRSHPSTGGTDSIASLTSVVLYPGGGGATPRMFAPRLYLASHGDGFFAGYPSEFGIREYGSSGELTRIVRRSWEPVSVTGEMVSRYGSLLVDLRSGPYAVVPEPLREQRRRVVQGMGVASVLPAFTAVLTDASGNVWVRETSLEHLMPTMMRYPVFPARSHWSVFDPDGAWLGSVETPPNYFVFDIGDDFIAGVEHDDLGVEKVQVYQIYK